MEKTLQQLAFEAKCKNWAILIQDKIERLIKEHINDLDLAVKVINNDFADMAQEEFSVEKSLGLWDNQNIWIGG